MTDREKVVLIALHCERWAAGAVSASLSMSRIRELVSDVSASDIVQFINTTEGINFGGKNG